MCLKIVTEIFDHFITNFTDFVYDTMTVRKVFSKVIINIRYFKDAILKGAKTVKVYFY